MNNTIDEVITVTRAEMHRNGISLRTQLAPDLRLVQADRVQLQQVLLNLIVNAVEALAGAKEGSRELLISTTEAESDGVFVAVRDSGPGLASNLERPFEAFYTTNPAAWAWAYRSAARLSKLTGDDCGPRRTNRRVPSFSSRYRRNKTS
jgi:C4-dicarboxylate-specific signal transduction histidine kinase